MLAWHHPGGRLRAIKSDTVANLEDDGLTVGAVAARHGVTSRTSTILRLQGWDDESGGLEQFDRRELVTFAFAGPDVDRVDYEDYH